MTRCNAYPNNLNKPKRLHHLKSQPIFAEASQTEWCEPFDCLTRFSGFQGLLRLLGIVLVDDWDTRWIYK